VVIDKSIAQHAAMCMENAESLDEVRELARLLRDDVEYRVRLYSYCITKSTENYRTWLSDEYMRRLEAEVRVLWRVSVINAEE
jgi:Txe/YoeB family toxin of Txe-Axe toxin-antitoxin module